MIQFGTGGWRAVIGDGFTRSNIQKIAAALGRRIRREGVQREICIGYDRRFLSREAAIWFSEAITGEGVKVDFINLSCPTPQVMYTVKKWNLPYGAAITASHNPALYNGVKLFTKGGRDAGQDVTDAIQDEANAMSDVDVHLSDFKECLRAGAISFIDPRDDYLDSILARVDTSAIRRRRPRIVIDPMYGVSLTGLMTILYSSRCDVDVIHDTHDAFFGRRLPAPTLDTLADLQRQVLEHNADLGIATDGDADRLGVIDERGRYISANLVLVLLYYYLLKYKGWKGAAVRNVATTHRGESSGGLTVRGHIFGKDGLYAASLLVEMLSVTGKPLSAMVEDIYREFGELHVAERDWPLTEAGKAEINAKVFDRHGLPDFGIPMAKVSWMDGCKVWFGSEEAAKSDGWLILRFSGTEPRLRIFAEAGTMGEAEALVDIMARYVGLKN